MKTMKLVCLLLILLALGAGTDSKRKETKNEPVPAPVQPAKAVPGPNYDQLSKNLDTYLQEQHFNGSVLVIRDGKTILDKGYGFADFEKNIENKPTTKFRIGSITKTVIAAAVLQLQEQGKLDIHHNVHQYVSSFLAEKNITLFHLLTHTSGLPEEGKGKVNASNHEQLVKWIGSQSLAFEPGKGWLYSDRNYMVLSYIIEKVSGEPLSKYVTEHIFLPADMHDSGMGEENQDAVFSKGYRKNDKGIVPAAKPFAQWLYGCGEMYTTTGDMKKLDEALMNGKLLQSSSIKLMFTASDERKYGFGFYVYPDFYHNHGVVSGWNTFNNMNWQKQTFVITFSNIQNSINDDFNKTFRNLVMSTP
ncbi:serine hydrolase domain-containing protein [Ectobacillus panaciterrae]|uniref:serine hydrolase domain-containing protein n=1 Tax=Ectobacillus panaciterrae TaxID=363872 RepID=UPI00041EFD81|nr:serine hydrolase domain-containing protein [Ectobacillus panaciterrae]